MRTINRLSASGHASGAIPRPPRVMKESRLEVFGRFSAPGGPLRAPGPSKDQFWT